jgi:hypothetical protein
VLKDVERDELISAYLQPSLWPFPEVQDSWLFSIIQHEYGSQMPKCSVHLQLSMMITAVIIGNVLIVWQAWTCIIVHFDRS